MSEWKEYKLNEVCEILTGFPFKGDEYESTGNLKVLRGENVTIGKLRWDSEKHWNKSTKGLEKYFLIENDIVIGMDGSRVGQNRAIIKQNELPLILAQRVARLRAKQGFNQKFLWYHIYSNYFKDYVEAIHTGTSIPHISQSQIADFEITAPPLPEQTAIAEVLSSLDDKIDLLHRQNKTLEQLAETLFRQWFVEEADESWEVGTLGEVISIYDSKRIPLSSGEREKMKVGQLYPYYGAASIMDYVNDYIFDGEYILMGEDGTVQTPDGFPILQLATGKFWVNNHAHIFEAKPPFTNFFIYTFLKQTNISGIVTGAVQPKINQEALKNIEFPIPPIEKTNEFITVTNEFWNRIKSNTQQIRTLTQLRDTLLPKLMSGEIRLNGDFCD